MMIVGKHTTKILGEFRKFEATVKMDKDELDLLVWAMEAFVVKSGGMPVHRFALDTLDGLKSVYKMADK